MKKFASLPHLPAFEAAARLGSFRLATNELCITTGAVSRHVRCLEEQLGVQLFYRAHKSVRLNEAGHMFSRVATRLLCELAAMEKSLRVNAPSGRLTVQCLPTFAMHWLMPRLSSLNEIHPELIVDVTTSIGPVSFDSPFDVAIRRDPAHFSGMNAVPFLQESSVLVCSENYLKKKPLISPERLEDHVKIQIRAREDLWKSWYAQFPNEMHDNIRTIMLDHTFAAIQAAEDGLGLVVIPQLFCAKHLESGRLISPFKDVNISTGEYYLLWRDRNDEAVGNFLDWLRFNGEYSITQP